MVRKEGFQTPKTKAEYSKLVEEMYFEVACVNFLTHNPTWINDLPDLPNVGPKDRLMLRAEYDSRITFPTEYLPVDILSLLDGSQKYCVVMVLPMPLHYLGQTP